MGLRRVGHDWSDLAAAVVVNITGISRLKPVNEVEVARLHFTIRSRPKKKKKKEKETDQLQEE